MFFLLNYSMQQMAQCWFQTVQEPVLEIAQCKYLRERDMDQYQSDVSPTIELPSAILKCYL